MNKPIGECGAERSSRGEFPRRRVGGTRFFIPSPEASSVFNSQTEIVGIAAGICTSTSLLPQLFKMVKDRKADDISLFYLLILFTGLAGWLWYGILREDVPILVTNGFSLVINSVIIVLGIRFKRAQSKIHLEND